jgi:hypothetical protein
MQRVTAVRSLVGSHDSICPWTRNSWLFLFAIVTWNSTTFAIEHRNADLSRHGRRLGLQAAFSAAHASSTILREDATCMGVLRVKASTAGYGNRHIDFRQGWRSKKCGLGLPALGAHAGVTKSQTGLVIRAQAGSPLVEQVVHRFRMSRLIENRDSRANADLDRQHFCEENLACV